MGAADFKIRVEQKSIDLDQRRRSRCWDWCGYRNGQVMGGVFCSAASMLTIKSQAEQTISFLEKKALLVQQSNLFSHISALHGRKYFSQVVNARWFGQIIQNGLPCFSNTIFQGLAGARVVDDRGILFEIQPRWQSSF